MELYKLYQIVHRRTDWPDLCEWQRRVMMPEWYEERERRGRAAIARLMAFDAVIRTSCGNNYFLN